MWRWCVRPGGVCEGVGLLLQKEEYCKAEIKTIARLRKKCRNKEIETMLKEKYLQYKDELNK